jgi:hypothetical protein
LKQKAHEQTFQKDFQRCEVAMLHQRVKQLNRHLLANAVPLVAKKRIREPSRNIGAEFSTL